MINLDLMRKRLMWQGGVAQEDRMIMDKFRTLEKALLFSYQACKIQLAQSYSSCLMLDEVDPEFSQSPEVKALINPDKVKQDYDDKILSVPYQHNFNPGDVFEWKKTDTFWIIYLQEITEDAYFRGQIRRCRYKINFKDNEGNWCSTWAAIRGPVETQINSIQKNQERIDQPNLSLNILMPYNDKTIHAFDRYAEFLFAGRCWRVEAPDSISMKNIIEVNAEEYYIDKDTDDIKNEMKNGLVIEPVESNPDSKIKGPTFIKPKISEIYTIDEPNGKWSVLENNIPVRVCPSGSNQATITWNKITSGQFTLLWEKENRVEEKLIVVESLY